MNSNRKIVF